MKLHWLIPGTLINFFMLSLLVYAARLKSWRYDANYDPLEIKTEADAQLQAQHIFHSTRLVIDLPRTLFGLS